MTLLLRHGHYAGSKPATPTVLINVRSLDDQHPGGPRARRASLRAKGSETSCGSGVLIPLE
jgi:hypothetical protein